MSFTVEDFLGRCNVLPIDKDTVSLDLEGLVELANSCVWKKVAENAEILLKDRNNKDYIIILQLRFEALFRLKMFDELTSEVITAIPQLISNPNIPESKASHIALSMKLLLAEVKFLTGRGDESLEQLYYILNDLKSNINAYDLNEAQTQFWKIRTEMNIINIYIRQRQMKLVVNRLQSLIYENSEILKEINDTRSGDEFKRQYIKSFVQLLAKFSRLLLSVI